ncbi:alpha/beta fold hydrolase [Nonomuraea sp. NPDC050786]|uniref:alpha/beta fold hydrolase n=1 Tax=Nonomuraea sp. NPDC050786 TaxID=3154840 RepID=UPI0033C7731C
MERRLYVLAACALIVAAVLGSAWITGQFTTPEVDRTDGYVSELAARDQPWTRLFRVSDVLSGLACAFGVAMVPRAAREGRGWLALAAFGLLNLATGLFPLDCATLSDPSCGRRAMSSAHYAHLLAGVLATGAALVAMALLSSRWRSWVSWLFTWLGLAATLLVLAAHADGHGVGIAHRAQLTAFAIWLVYAALHLLVSDDVTARVSAPPEDLRPHVVEQGSGPAVIVAAGLGGAWYHWDAVAARLAATHRVIRFDRPGLGLSPCSPDPPTLYGEAARLAALAPAHPEQVTVVAQGVGCWHAEAFARLHPLRVAGLVLVDPAGARERMPFGSAAGGGAGAPERTSFGSAAGGGAGGRERAPSASAAGACRWLPALGGTWGATALARVAGPPAHRLLTGMRDPYGVYRAGKVSAAVAGEWLARRDMVADLHRMRADRPLPDVPVTVISTGARDAVRLAGLLSARLVRLPHCGRRILLENPQAIADAVSGGWGGAVPVPGGRDG